MAYAKITDLGPATVPLAGTELVEITQSGSSAKVAVSDIAGTFDGLLDVENGGTGLDTIPVGEYLKGNGTSPVSTSATIPFGDISERAYLSAYSAIDQTGNVSAATSVIVGTTALSQGISMVNNGSGNSTRITFDVGGVYSIMPSIQLSNSDGNDHDVTFWFRKNGSNIAASATTITVPKASDGGAAFFQIVFYEQVVDNDYIELMWLPENVAVTLDYISAGAIAPSVPSVILCVERIA